MFDRDNSGNIDVNELRDAMKALGIYLKKDEVKTMMARVDKDGSGSIELDEFMALMAEKIVILRLYNNLIEWEKPRRRTEESIQNIWWWR